MHSAEVAPLINPVKTLDSSIRFEVIPSFEEMLSSTPEHYPYQKSFEKARDDPVVVLHSSGSTGMNQTTYSTTIVELTEKRAAEANHTYSWQSRNP
jgi:acyl-coenzyme A synthetase/AMP-(fatty) acid ligase